MLLCHKASYTGNAVSDDMQAWPTRTAPSYRVGQVTLVSLMRWVTPRSILADLLVGGLPAQSCDDGIALACSSLQQGGAFPWKLRLDPARECEGDPDGFATASARVEPSAKKSQLLAHDG